MNSHQLVMPIRDEAEKRAYENELLLSQANYEHASHEAQRLEIDAKLLAEIQAFVSAQQSYQNLFEDYFVSPFFRTAWQFVMNAAILVKETVKTAKPAITSILFPFYFGIEGIRGLWDLHRTKEHAVHSRKAQIGVGLFNIAAAIAGIVVLGLAISSPFALPIIFASTAVMAIFKTAMIASSISTKIRHEKAELSRLNSEINEFGDEAVVDVAAKPQLDLLKAQHARVTAQLGRLKEERFQTRREVVVNTLGAISTGLLIAGLFFPPLIPAGLFMMAGVGLAALVDAKTNTFFSRGVANVTSSIKNSVSSFWKNVTGAGNRLKAALSPVRPAAQVVPNMEAESGLLLPQVDDSQLVRSDHSSHLVQHSSRAILPAQTAFNYAGAMDNDDDVEGLLTRSTSRNSNEADQSSLIMPEPSSSYKALMLSLSDSLVRSSDKAESASPNQSDSDNEDDVFLTPVSSPSLVVSGFGRNADAYSPSFYNSKPEVFNSPDSHLGALPSQFLL